MNKHRVGKYKTVTKFIWFPTHINKKLYWFKHVDTTYKMVYGEWVEILKTIK